MLTIETMLAEAKANQWPYPKTFQMIADAGVEYYVVKFVDNYDASYVGTSGVWHEPVPAGYVPSVLSDTFCAEGVKAAIKRHMSKQTNFVQLLVELAAQGVSHYRVDMKDRTVTYFNEDESQSNVEHVPVWKE